MADELGMDLAAMEAVTKDFTATEAPTTPVDIPLTNEIIPSDELSSDAAALPDTDFWGDPVESETTDEASDELAADTDVPPAEAAPADDTGIIAYKANGKDISLDLSNPEHLDYIAKLLPLAEGARKTFSDKNKLRQEVKSLRDAAANDGGYKSAWDKLEAIKHDHSQVYEAITGQSFDEMIQRKIDERMVYDQASDGDKQSMDSARENLKLEDRIKRMEEARDKQVEEARSLNYEANKQSMSNQLKSEYAKYEFNSGNAATDNKLRQMLWTAALGDVAQYKKDGYKMNEKVYAKAFRDNANALQHNKKIATAKSDAATRAATKATAKEAVAAAATKNYSGDQLNEKLVSMNPNQLFEWFRK